MRKIAQDLIKGLQLLEHDILNFDISPISRTAQLSTAPEHSVQTRITVELARPLSDLRIKRLTDLGWVSEQDGEFWLLTI